MTKTDPNMTKLRLILLLILLIIVPYTAVVIWLNGMNYLPVFFAPLGAFGWQGQFNIDFACYLTLTGLWIAWRHDFSGMGIVLAVFSVGGGLIFLAIYLAYETRHQSMTIPDLLLPKAKA